MSASLTLSVENFLELRAKYTKRESLKKKERRKRKEYQERQKEMS